MASVPSGLPAHLLMRSFARLIPFLAVVIIGLAFYQIYGAFLAASAGNWPFAVFYALFGFAGLVLVRALWTHRKGLNRHDAETRLP